MTRDRRALGAAGEDAAAAHLERRGYRILARNVRADGVELDLVAERRGVLVFVEVKARRSGRFGGGAAAVDARKRERLARGAAAWLHASGRRARRVRFDVITWEPVGEAGGAEPVLVHWEGAFEAGD